MGVFIMGAGREGIAEGMSVLCLGGLGSLWGCLQTDHPQRSWRRGERITTRSPDPLQEPPTLLAGSMVWSLPLTSSL